ncbi:MAG: long-chain-fatty-acid--CoA ligase [Alphaproteobacteria bacterium]|nr:long-chain-fatty-acid--CoA ligase [Alphaproteobacteria bacterium]
MLRLTQLLHRAVQINPRGTATVCGERRRSWTEARDRAARCAAGVTALGCAPGDRVAILALNSDRYFEGLFGLAWGNFIVVPINTRLAPPEIAFWLADSGCKALLVDDVFLPALPAVRALAPELEHIIHIGDGPTPAGAHAYEAMIAAATPGPDICGSGDDIAALFYTGGTTGRSKGVMLSHSNIVLNMLNTLAIVHFQPDAVYVHAAPMFHIADATMTFVSTGIGAKQIFLPRFDPAGFLAAVQEHRATDALLVPTMVNMVVNFPDIGKYDLSSLKHVIYGASPMPEAVIRKGLEVMPQTMFTQAYGQTEAAPVLTLLDAREHGTAPDQLRRMRSAGRGVLGWDVRIHDEDDNEVPRGIIGEICGRGPAMMRGYWNQPELSAHTLRNGWLHTGDGGYMDEDGYIYIVDRLKDMIVSGGENVYSAEVESAVYSHPAVAECAVIGVPDDKWGERVHAIVRCKPGMSVDEAALISHCHTLIAGFKSPRSVVFRDEPLPLSGAGKILKTDLRKPYWEGQGRQVH